MNSGFDELVGWFRDNGERAIVALSGGVDSAVVAAAAKRALGAGAIAVTADYKTLSKEELSYARKIAMELCIEHKIIEYNELENPEFAKNDEQRCYHCRAELGMHLLRESREVSVPLIVDGTNADDLTEFRPGIRAMREAGVRSPLAELGFRKSQIRQMAGAMGLSVYDKPSNACLASRIPTGQLVTIEKLQRIEQAEIAVKSITGIRQVRVRHHDEIARIEVASGEIEKLFSVEKLGLIDAKLKELGYRYVAIDTAGYRSGNLVILNGRASRE